MKLAAQTRTVFGKQVASLRKDGLVPAEVYGHGIDNMHLSVAKKDLAKAIKEAGHSGIIMLSVDGKETRVLAHDWSIHPTTGEIAHVDFHSVKAGQKIEAEVHIVFEGEAPAVKEGLGILTKNLHALEVEGVPEKIPHEFTIDVRGLAELGSVIHASDVKMPVGVTLVTDADAVIVSIAEVMEDEPEETMTVADVAVEGEEEKKDDAEQA